MIRAIQFQNKRVGSTFLQNAINSHPDIMGIDEVFVNMARKPGMKKSGFTPFLRSDHKNVKDYIENVIYKKYTDKNIIFKLMYNQINFHNGLFDYVKRNNIPIIHLMRKNLVKQIVSGITAATTKHKPISITPQGMMNSVVEADKLNEYWQGKLKSNIKMTLYYEDIIGENIGERTFLDNKASIAICRFFGVEDMMLYAETKKKNKKDLSVYLPNLKEIREYFEGSKYKWMLEDKNG